MSWSVSASGKLQAVKQSVKKQFASSQQYLLTHNPVEAKLQDDVRKLVNSALRKQSKQAASVSVSVSGHEGTQYVNGQPTGEKVQAISISVSASFPS